MQSSVLTCVLDEDDCPKDVKWLRIKVGHVTKNRLGNFHVTGISMIISVVNVSVVGTKTN